MGGLAHFNRPIFFLPRDKVLHVEMTEEDGARTSRCSSDYTRRSLDRASCTYNCAIYTSNRRRFRTNSTPHDTRFGRRHFRTQPHGGICFDAQRRVPYYATPADTTRPPALRRQNSGSVSWSSSDTTMSRSRIVNLQLPRTSQTYVISVNPTRVCVRFDVYPATQPLPCARLGFLR